MRKRILIAAICCLMLVFAGCGATQKENSKKDETVLQETELEISTEVVNSTELEQVIETEMSTETEMSKQTEMTTSTETQEQTKQETPKKEPPKQETQKEDSKKEETTQSEQETSKQEQAKPENNTQPESQTPEVTPQEPEVQEPETQTSSQPERGQYLVKGQSLYGASFNVGDAMYDITVTTVNDETVVLSEVLQEKDMVMLNFWATWCGPCMNEFPYMSEAYNAYKDDIEIIAFEVEASNSKENIESYRQYYGWQFKVAQGVTSWVYAFNPNVTIPTSVIIDRYGIIREIHVGSITSVEGFTSIFDSYIGDNYQP